MNEEVINDLYNNAVSKGYKKSREEFVSLLQSNDAVMNDMYSYVQSKGYKKGVDDFKILIGATVESPMAVAEEPKKKGATVSPFVDGGLEPTKFDPRTGQVVQDTPAFAQKQPEVTVPKQKLPERTEFQFQPGKPLPAQKAAPLPKFVEEQLTAVTPDLIGKTEENVVPQLKYQFGPLGFKFEETGAGDYMIATSPSGESIEVSLDITDIDGKKAEANKLNAFLRKGATTVKNISTLQKQYVDANKKITSQKELDDSLASINAEEANIMAKNTEFAKLQTSLESERARLESVPPQQRNNPEYIARVNDFISRADQFSNEFQTFVKDAQDLDKRGQQLNKSIGKYTEMKAQQGTWYGAALNAVANKSFYNMAKGFSGLAIDFLGEVIPTQAIMSQDDYEKNFIEQAKKEGIDVTEGQDFVSLTSKLDEATIAKIENRVRDVAKKTVKGDIIGSLNKASNMAMESSGVSPEYYRSIEETFVGGALLGALTSIPAMAGGPVARTILMSSQVLAGLDDEMNNDPAFEDISENEKLLVKAPIAVAVGILENIGLSNLMNQKGFLNGLVFRALGRVGTGSSYRTFGEAIRNEIDSAVARGALIMGAGVLAEVETGALQEVADITAKEIYNIAKEKEMFNTPDSIVQFVKEVGKAGIQEGIGAGVLTIPGSISAAYRGKGFIGMDDAQFAMFEKMANDLNIEKGFVARLKSRINSGDITAAEGKEILNNYRNSVGLFNSLPDNLDMQGKKEAMNLLKEKRDLERQIDGKDQSLTVTQRNRVNEINQQLTKLSEDAIQKQAAGQVPVQPGATVSQEVAQGEPQAEPQGVTKENIKEKITEVNNKSAELSNRQKAEVEELNKRENKNYADAFDILNVNEYSQDQTQRSQDAIDLANRHEKEFNDLLQEKRNIESEADKINFSTYNLTDTNKLDRLRGSINSVYQNNRSALDEGFEASVNALEEANSVGASDYVAHGMGKTSLANAYNDLINLFNKGINPIRGRGSLDVAPLSGGVSTGTTASGNAYMDGPFTLVANRNHSGPITNIDQVGGIIVNEGIATPEVMASLRDLFPNLVVESTTNTKSLVEQLNARTQEGQVQEQVDFTKEDQAPIKKGVSEFFELNPALAAIGTAKDYSDYLDTIFPDSQIKNIAYHDSNSPNIEKFRNDINGIWTTGDPNWWQKGEYKYRVIIDVKSPKIIRNPLNSSFAIDFFSDKNNDKFDTYITTGLSGNLEEGVYVLRDSDQVHILGSNKDLNDFKKFVSDGGVTKKAANLIEPKAQGGVSPTAKPDATPTVELTDDQIVEYNRTEEVSDKNGEVLIKVFKSKKFEPTAEPIMTDLGDSVVFEYNNFDDDDTRTWFIFKKKKDGSITGNGVKVERNRGNLRNTRFFKNYIESKRAELAAQQPDVETKYTKENLPALNVELQKLFKKQNRLQNQFEKTEDPVVEAELDKTNEELTFLSTKIEELESSVTPEVAAQPKASTKTPVSKKKNKEEIISRPAFTPITLARQWLLSGGKLRSIQSEENKMRGVGVGKGVREETGMGGVEMRQFIGVIDNKRGLSPEVAAERIYENLNEELQASMDVQDIRDAIIEVVSSEDRKTWIENQDRETSEREDFDEYDQWMYSQLTDQERADFDEYQQRESYFDYLNQNAKQLAKEYDAYIKSQTYQDYIEEIYGREREGQDNAQDQNDGRGKEQGTDGEKITVQTKEQVESDLNELLKLNPKEKSTGQKAIDYLDSLLKDYDKIERGGIGMNIALPTIKKIIQGIRALVKAGMALNDAIKKVAKDNNVSVEDVINGIDEIGKQIKKSAPSAAKILGKPRKKVTVDEMAALKDQIKLEARAAREAKGDLNKKRKALAARIISARRNGFITAAQARALVNRISKVNLDNPIMVDRLIEYTDKVFDNANYAADMAELRKLQKQAKSRNHASMTNVVNQFTSINPEDIPLDRIQDYKEALDFLNTRTPFYGNMNEVFDEMLSYKVAEKFDAVKTKDALMDKYKGIMDNKLETVEDYVNLIKDINAFKRKAYQLLQNDAITQEEYDDLINGAGETQADIEKKFAEQIAKIKKDLIAEIKNQRPRVSRDFSKEENDLIRRYLELSDSDLESLSPEDLFILNDLLDNISNGEIDVYRFGSIVSKAYTSNGVDPLAKQINSSKSDMTSEEGMKELAENESAFWEGLLGMGRAKSGALQKYVVSVFNRAIASYENLTRNGYNEFLKLKKKYKIDRFDLLNNSKDMHKIGMLTTYLQEYMAQFDPKNEGINNIGKRDWFKEILSNKSMRDKYSSGKPSVLKVIGLGKSEIDIIEEIWNSLPKDANGNVDPKAVYDSYMANDGKFFTKNQRGFFDEVMAYKTSEITTKQKFANEINGTSFKEIPFHMMRVRLDGGKTQITPTASSDNGVVRIKAGTGKERVSEAVGPIMTNFEKLFITNLEQTGRDYFLSGALNDINNTLSGAKKKINPDKMPVLDTISGTLSEALGYEFDRMKSEMILSTLLSARAATTLLNPIRTAVELGATLLSYPLRAKTLSGYKDLFGKQKEMSKLLEFTDSPLRLRQNINNAIDINDGRIEPQSRLTKATAYLSGLPERTMMVTSWMPTFRSEFKDITGVDFDIKKFNDSEAYREKYGKAIKEASSVADAQTEKIIGPTTKAGQRREIRIAPRILANIIGREGTVSKNTIAGQILGFFSNYPYRESSEFINGFKESAEVIKDEGALSSLSQLQKPLGIALNVAAYGFLSSASYALGLMLLGDDDDEKRGDELLKDLITGEGFLNELASNAISLAGSRYAAGGKALLQLAATIAIESTDDENQKAKIKKLLKDSVFVDPLPIEQATKFGGRDKALSAIGMYIPQFVMLADRYTDIIGSKNEIKAIYDKVESKGISSLTQDEETRVLALNTLFNATQLILNLRGTSIPLYNNIKTYMKKLKQEAGVSDVYKGEVPDKKKSSGGGGGSRAKTMNKSDLKRYFPDQYNELYGEGSATYEIEQEVKAFEKEQRELKKRIKDQVYGGKD